MTKNLAPETVAAQAGGAIDEETGAIVPPLHITTTFLRDPDNQYRKGYTYGRRRQRHRAPGRGRR